jgi:predicted dehydrogenase
MIGGGTDSFIGRMHVLGASLSGSFELVAGAFSNVRDQSLASGAAYGVDPSRCHADVADLIADEAGREDGVQAVAIATPNHLHLPAALQAINAGLHIISDKPATATLDEALRLRDALSGSASRYAVTYSYTAYPMVREARARIAAGQIGAVRKVVVTYLQGWLAAPLETSGNERAAWRTDPSRSGVGGAVTDIGVHAFNLAEFVLGDPVDAVLADLAACVPGRALDDDCNVLLRFANGARGALIASQVAFGERNSVSIQVFGDAGAVHWTFDRPEELKWVHPGGTEILTAMSPSLLTREPLPPGLGGGLVTPFTLLYRDFGKAIAGDDHILDGVLPGIEAGVRSLLFIDRVVQASADGAGWTPLR